MYKILLTQINFCMPKIFKMFKTGFEYKSPFELCSCVKNSQRLYYI